MACGEFAMIRQNSVGGTSSRVCWLFPAQSWSDAAWASEIRPRLGFYRVSTKTDVTALETSTTSDGLRPKRVEAAPTPDPSYRLRRVRFAGHVVRRVVSVCDIVNSLEFRRIRRKNTLSNRNPLIRQPQWHRISRGTTILVQNGLLDHPQARREG